MTILKRNLLPPLVMISLLPTPSFASAAFKDGFYMGAKIGAQQAMTQWDQSDLATSHFTAGLGLALDLQVHNPNTDGQAFQTNLMGNLAVGYARVRNQFFLALEASSNLGDGSEMNWETHGDDIMHFEAEGGTIIMDSVLTLDTRTTVEIENPDLILDLRPGYLLAKNFLLYGRIGVALNELSIEQDITTTAVGESNFGGSVVSDEIKGSAANEDEVCGLRLGLGLEYKATPRLGLSVDYVFTDYGDIDIEYADRHVDIDHALSTSSQVLTTADVTASTLMAGFNWYFGG